MRLNVYAEEMTDRMEIIHKGPFEAIRFYLALPASYHQSTDGDVYPAKPGDEVQAQQLQAPFIHHLGDDDSSAVTFWSRKSARDMFAKAVVMIDVHHAKKSGMHCANGLHAPHPLDRSVCKACGDDLAACGHTKAAPETGYDCVKCGVYPLDEPAKTE